jgi:hypothetical protein
VKEKESQTTFAVTLQTAKVMAAVDDKHLVNIEKTLNLCMYA